jgi:hypothetical protein
MTALATPPKLQFLDANGAPLVGGKLYTYAAGTTTPLATYTDYGGGTANANPVILDSRGEASVWLGTALYKMALYSATDVLIWTVDNIGGFATLAQLAASGGSNLVGFLQAGTGAVATTVQAKLRESVSVKDFGAVGDGVADDSAAFLAAFNTGKRVYAPAATYATNLLNMPTNSYLYGDGESTIIIPYNVTGLGALGANSGSASTYITGLVIRDVKFLGSVVANGFQEQCHLLVLEGVKRCRIDNVYFEGFRGDGFYLGAGRSGTERHNFDVIVKNCVFDGVNNDNRNGLSVIDADGLEVEACVFRNCARSDMPGSLDLEPDAAVESIKNIRILNNRFYNTNGNRGHICIQTQNTALLENVIIRGNHFEDAGTESSIVMNLKTTTPTTPQRIIIEGNTSYNPSGNFVYKRDGYTNGISIANNISTHLRGVWFSTAGVTMVDTNITVRGNQFTGGDAGNFGVLFSQTTTNVAICGNSFFTHASYHIRFGNTGAVTYASIRDNDFYGAAPSSGAIQDSSPSGTGVTNILQNNRFDFVTHTMRAGLSDFTGSLNNTTGADEATLPSAFVYGVSMTHLSNRTIDGANQSGMLYTHKQSSVTNTAIWQQFIPDYDATYRDDFYFRKAIDASTWDSWWQVTGV